MIYFYRILSKISQANFLVVDLNNLESELDENQKDFIYEYSSLQRKHIHDYDLKQVRERKRTSNYKPQIKRSFFSLNNLTYPS